METIVLGFDQTLSICIDAHDRPNVNRATQKPAQTSDNPLQDVWIAGALIENFTSATHETNW